MGRTTKVILYKLSNGLRFFQLGLMASKLGYLQGDVSITRYHRLPTNLTIWSSFEIDIAGIIGRSTNVILYKSSKCLCHPTLDSMICNWRNFQGDASVNSYPTLPSNLPFGQSHEVETIGNTDRYEQQHDSRVSVPLIVSKTTRDDRYSAK